MLMDKTSRKREVNIYTRIRKVINFDKKKKKLEEKIFRSADYARYFAPSPPLHPLFENSLLFMLCYYI